MKTLTGVVIKQAWAPGSKSEHDALVLVDHKTQKRYRLRQDGGPAFQDPQLDPLEGCTIKAKGEVVHGNTLEEKRIFPTPWRRAWWKMDYNANANLDCFVLAL